MVSGLPSVLVERGCERRTGVAFVRCGSAQRGVGVSDRIHRIRFPLIIAVVAVHSGIGQAPMAGYSHETAGGFLGYWIHVLFFQLLPLSAVPLLTVVSGYLFFKGQEGTMVAFGRKLRGRIRTLLVPYLVWNSLILAVYYLGSISRGSASLFGRTMADVGERTLFENLIQAIGSGEAPICQQFWFIRNLICVFLASPLIYFLLRRGGIWFCGAITLAWLAGVQLIPAWRLLYTLVFVCWGGYLAIAGFDIGSAEKRLRPCLIGAFFVLSLFVSYQAAMTGLDRDAIGVKAVRLLGCVVAWVSFSWMGKDTWLGRWCVRLEPYAFFVFATHILILIGLSRAGGRIPLEYGIWVRLAGSAALTVVAVIVSVFAAEMMRRLLPAIYSFATGGR